MNSFYSVLNNWHVKKCVIEACFCTAVYYCAALAILAQPKVSFDNEDYYELSVTGLYNNWTASLVLFTSFYTWASTHTHTHTSMDATGTTRGSACGPRMLQHVDRSSQGIDRPTSTSQSLHPCSHLQLLIQRNQSSEGELWEYLHTVLAPLPSRFLIIIPWSPNEHIQMSFIVWPTVRPHKRLICTHKNI